MTAKIKCRKRSREESRRRYKEESRKRYNALRDKDDPYELVLHKDTAWFAPQDNDPNVVARYTSPDDPHSNGWASLEFYDIYFDMTPYREAYNLPIEFSAKNIAELRARTMKYLAKRSDPDYHINNLYERGFFCSSVSTLADGEAIIEAYIEEHGGCKKDEARKFIGLTKPKVWKREEVTFAQLSALLDEGYDLRFNEDGSGFGQIVPWLASPLRTMHQEAQRYGFDDTMTVVVWVEREA